MEYSGYGFEFEKPQFENISDRERAEISLNFYLMTSRLDTETAFRLKFRNVPALSEPIKMTRLDENIFHVFVQIPNQDKNGRHLEELKYSFVKVREDGHEDPGSKEVEQEKTKAKKYFDLESFFDIFQNKKQLLTQLLPTQKKEYYEQLIHFFVKQYEDPSSKFGSPKMFQEFSLFLEYDNQSFPLSQTLSVLTKDYLDKLQDTELLLYIIELISYIDPKKVQSKSQALEPILREMVTLQFGSLRKIIFEQQKKENYMDIVRGFQCLIKLQPLLGLEFFDNTFFIPSQQIFLEKQLMLKDEFHFNKMKTVILQAKMQDVYQDVQSVQTLILFMLKQSKSLEALLDNVEYFREVATEDIKLQGCKEVKSNLDKQSQQKSQYPQFVAKNINRLLAIPQFRLVFQTDILSYFLHVLKTQPQNEQHAKLLYEHSGILTLGFLGKAAVNIDNNPHLQKIYMDLLILHIPRRLEQKPFNSVKDLIALNFYHIIKAGEIQEQYHIMSKFYDQIHNQVFNLIPDYDVNHIQEKMVKQMYNQFKQQHNLQSVIKFAIKAPRDASESQVSADPKLELLAKVITRLMEEACLDQDGIMSIFKSLFPEPQYSLRVRELKPISDQAFKVLAKMFDKEKRKNLFDDDLVLYILKIGNHVTDNDLIQRVKRDIQEFVLKLSAMTITLNEVEQVVMQQSKNLVQIIKIVDPSFNLDILEKLKAITLKYKLCIDKYQNYLNWAEKSDINVYVKGFQQKMNQITLYSDKLEIRRADSLEMFAQFAAYKTVDLFYLFRDSKVFENIFMGLGQEVHDNNLHFEEYKDPTTGAYQVKLEGYDAVCMEYLFGKQMHEHFKCLIGYPQKQILAFEINKIWKDIRPEQVDPELVIISEYLRNHQQSNPKYKLPSSQFSVSLSKDLKNFTRQDSFIKRSEIINNLDCYQKKSEAGAAVSLSGALHRMALFTDLMKNDNPTESLEQISERISKISEDFQTMERYKIKWDLLEEYVRSKDTYVFCIQEQGFSFSSLYEKMDDSSTMTNRTIEGINSVSTFFTQLYAKIESEKSNQYEVVLQILSQELENQIIADPDFQGKLVNCNANLQEIKSLTKSSRNDAENTLLVIENALMRGCFIFYSQRKKFHFVLEIQSKDKPQERSSLEDPSQEVMAQTQRKANRMTKEKIIQHSVRAKLFIHSKKSSALRHEEVIESDKIFTSSVDLCVEIHQHLQDLKNYGHLDFQNDADYYEFLKVPINRGSIVKTLKFHQKQFKESYDELRQSLYNQRSEFYFLNYVPNSLIAQLNSQSLDANAFKVILRKLEEIRVFKAPVPQQIFQSNKEELLEAMQGIWNQQNRSEAPPLRESSEIAYQLQSGTTQYRIVPDALCLVKAMTSIFAIAKMLPTYDRVLLCEEDTQLIEVQAFIHRAVFYPNCEKAAKPFVIANFQRLPFHIQLACYQQTLNFRGEQKEYAYNQSYTLYILSVQMANQTSRLIEILRNSHTYNQYLRDDALKDHLKKNYNNIEVVKSAQCGLGKTEYILNKGLKEPESQIIRIPIHGAINKKKFISIFTENAKKLANSNSKKVCIHYDVYPSGREDLNVILFELLILKCLNYHFQDIYQIPWNYKIFVEVSHSLNEKLPSLFINSNFSEKPRTWDFMSINAKEEPQNKFQKVCRYVHAVVDVIQKKNYDPQLLKQPRQQLSVEDCQRILRHNLTKLLKNPNYYYVNSYVDFVCDQIRRLEESPFFDQQNLIQQMTGYFGHAAKAKQFHQEIMVQLLALSEKISIVEKYVDSADPSILAIERRAQEEEQANRFREIEWDVYRHPFIVFNDGGDITAIFKDVTSVPEAYKQYHKMIHQKDKGNQILKAYSEYTQRQFIDKILSICVTDSRREKIRKMSELKSLVFTLDNFMKLVLIYLRIRNFQPILLMGETGVGKTSLVQYLCFLIDAEFFVLNVHAGISESDISAFVVNAQKVARSQEGQVARNKRKVILFFDEINTNENINGLLKEVFIDRHIYGQKLEENICLVAACNPFKLRPQEVSGLSSGLRVSDRDSTMSRLVYRVLPLPESFIPYIWDYKSLNSTEEEKYIAKMIEKSFEEAKIFGKEIKLVNLWLLDKQNNANQVRILSSLLRDIDWIGKTVFLAQNIIKKEEKTTWAVSLRDVSRFCKLFQYFLYNNYSYDTASRTGTIVGRREYQPRDIALVLALYFCYVIRIFEQGKRKAFLQGLERAARECRIQLECLGSDNFMRIVNLEQNRFIKEMEIKKGIGLSQTLKENIFVIITCILTNIPLIITGKPGSSKTLSINLISKSFKGQNSSNVFFRAFPEIVTQFFQGSEQTTSKSIEKLFKKAVKTQTDFKSRGSNSIVVVVFDEIGLAEQSKHNPNKILHSLLEPPKVAFVGISNWSLDASKMNRVITLSRYDPDKSDLKETAESIAKNCNPNFPQKNNLQVLVDWYLELMDKQRRQENTRDFHGLRDFYSLIKYIAPKITQNEENNNKVIVKGVLRNFGGLKNNEALSLLEDKLKIDSHQPNKPDQLIVENIEDQESRHLMIITDSFENTLEFIQDQCQRTERKFEIFYGSDFPDDQNEDATYEQITEIIFHMEHGSLVVFLNLKNVYQSFYDMLNQNYTEIGTQTTQKYSKVAVGADQSLFLVHPNFKCILIVDQSQLNELDGPLKNRFEKQLYTEDISSHNQFKQLKTDLSQWTFSISKHQRFDRKQMFPTLDETQSFQQLINQTRDIFKDASEETIKLECKRAIVRLANFQGILRSKLSSVPDKDFWYEEYFKNNNHFDLYSLLAHYYQNWREERCFENQQGFNLVVYTYSALIDEQLLPMPETTEAVVDLTAIHKKKQYSQIVENFFSPHNTKELLIITADMMTITKNIINLCRSKINSLRTQRQKNQMTKHVIFVIKLDFNGKSSEHSMSLGKIWRQYMVDMLNGRGHHEISIKQLFDLSYDQLLSEASKKQSIFEQALVESLSRIFYKKAQTFITERLQKIQKIFSIPENNDFLTSLILSKYQRLPKYEERKQKWRQDIVCNDSLMGSKITFHGAAIEQIRSDLVTHLAFVISHLEEDGIITAFENKDLFNMAKDYFKILYDKDIVNNRFYPGYYLNYNFDKIKFPLARVLHKQFQQLKVQFMKNDKRYMSLKSFHSSSFKNLRDFEILEQPTLSRLATASADEYGVNALEQSHVRLQSQRMRLTERENELAKWKIEKNDKYLAKNIKNLIHWCELYFPKEYINEKMLTENNQQYLEDFAYLNNHGESKSSDSSNNDYYKSYMKNMISLFLKERIVLDQRMNKAEIYGVYWKNDGLLHNVWKIISKNVNTQQVESYQKCENLLRKRIKEHPAFTNTDLNYLPREAFLQAVIKVFFELYYPAEGVQKNAEQWEENLKLTFQRLNDLSFYYQGVTQTNESRIMILLLKYYNQVVKVQMLMSKKGRKEDQGGELDEFWKLAKEIKHLFETQEHRIQEQGQGDPRYVMQIIDLLLNFMESNWSKNKNQIVKQNIFKIACEYLIESFELEETIEFSDLINNIFAYLTKRDENQHALNCLKQDESFKFILKNLVSIMMTLIKNQNYGNAVQSCFQFLIESNYENFYAILSNYPLLKMLCDFVHRYKDSLPPSDPFIVCFTDHLIDYIKYDPFDHQDRIHRALITVKKCILLHEPEEMSLQKLIAITAFKKISIIYVSEVEFDYKDEEETFAVQMSQFMDEFFDLDSEVQRAKMKPLAFYLAKQLYQKFDFLKTDRENLANFVKWVQQFQKIEENQVRYSFSFIPHSEFQTTFRQFQQNQLAVDENLAKKSQVNKFLQILAIIDFHYLQKVNQHDPLKEQQNPTASKYEQMRKVQTLEMDGLLENFLQPFIENSFERVHRNSYLQLEDRKIPQHFKLISMMIGAAGYASPSLFTHKFFLQPSLMKDCFIPFVQNQSDDFEYQKILQNNEFVTILECVICKRKTLRIDLEPQSDSNKSYIKMGQERKCQWKDSSKNKDCLGNLFMVRESLTSKEPQRPENLKNLGVKSYVQFSKDQYHSIQVRDLKKHHLAVGRIILHSMLMFNLAFSNLDTEVLSIILNDQVYLARQYEDQMGDALVYLTYCIFKDWEYLMTEFHLNDEKVSQLIQFVLFEMMKSSQNIFNVDYLKSFDGRSIFENHFKNICDKAFANNARSFFSQTLQKIPEFEHYMLEINPIQQNSLYHLLRSVNQISIQHFEREIKEGNDKDFVFFKALFLQKHSIKNLKHITHLIQWTRYIFQTYSAQLTLDEVNEMKIKDIFLLEQNQNESQREQQKKLRKDLRKFLNAWNTFAGYIIKAKEVEVVIPELTEESELMYCCITMEKKDLKGHVLYILLDYLQKKQKAILDEAQKLVEKTVYSIQFPQVYLLNVMKEHVVYFRDKKKEVNGRNRTYSQHVMAESSADLSNLELAKPRQTTQLKKYEEELFEDMIIKNSACKLNYSEGMSVEYDKSKIRSQTIDILLKGKHFIVMDDNTQKPNFQFLNLGNLYSQIREVAELIPQKKSHYSKSLADMIRSELEVYDVLQDLKTAFSYLTQSQENAEMSLTVYLREYKLEKLMKVLQNDILLHELKLKHILHFYQKLEKRVSRIQMGLINEKYKVPLSRSQSEWVSYTFKQNLEMIPFWQKALSRLCVRLLSSNYVLVDPSKPLFALMLSKEMVLLFGTKPKFDVQLCKIVFEHLDIRVEQSQELIKLLDTIYQANQHLLNKNQTQPKPITNNNNNPIKNSKKINQASKPDRSTQAEPQLSKKQTNQRYRNNNQLLEETASFIEEVSRNSSVLFQSVNPNESIIEKDQCKEMLYEEFFIITGDATHINHEQVSRTQARTTNLDSKIVYLHKEQSPKTTDQRKLSAKNFCFPNGVSARQAKDQLIQQSMRQQSSTFSSEDCFIFTIPTSAEEGYNQSTHPCFYFICIVFEDLVEVQSSRKRHFYFMQKAFCLMTLHPFYDFHLQVLNSIQSLYKNEKLRLEKILRKQIFSDIDLEKEVLIKIPLTTPDVVKLLNSNFMLQATHENINSELTRESEGTGLKKQKKTLTSKTQLKRNDLVWYAPQLLQVLSLDQFYELLYAVLSETSLIVVADSLPLLCAATQGIKAFLEPFVWCHSCISILPRDLMEITASPTPYIVGVLKDQYEMLVLDEITNQCIMLTIDTEKQSSEIERTGDYALSLPYFNNLKQILRKPFLRLHKPKESTQANLDRVNEEIVKILDLLKASITINLIQKLPLQVLKGEERLESLEDVKAFIIQNADQKDVAFVQGFLETQIFQQYAENRYCFQPSTSSNRSL